MCYAMPKSKNTKNRGKNCATKTKINEYSSQRHGARKKTPRSCRYMSNHIIFNPPPGFDISHANTMRRKIQNRQKLKTQRLKILTSGETFIISTALVSIKNRSTKNLLRPPLTILVSTTEGNQLSFQHAGLQSCSTQVK